MILTTHALAGAVIGKNIDNLWIVIVLSVTIHFIMDTLRHGEYVESKNPKTTLGNSLWKILLDLSIGFLIVGYFIYHSQAKNIQIINISLGVIFSVVPDFLTCLYWLFHFKFLKRLCYFHGYVVHRYPPTSPERKWNFRNARNDILISALVIILLFAT